jgi:hypothetical protein
LIIEAKLPLVKPALAVLVAVALASPTPVASADPAPPPPGVTACDFPALANDRTPEGLNIRTAPNTGAAILDRVPMFEDADHETIAADVHVIGVSRGWFLIEGAQYGGYGYPQPAPRLYRGRGWVSGRLLTTDVQQGRLLAAPDPHAAVVIDAEDEILATPILDCKGSWFRIEAPLSTKDQHLTPKLPSDGPPGTVRGWSNRSCTNQRTTCDYGGM